MNLHTAPAKPTKKKPRRQNKKKRRRRKPMIPSFMKPVMLIFGLIIGFAVLQTLIVLVKSR